MYWIWSLKKTPRFVPFWANLTHFGPKSGLPEWMNRQLTFENRDIRLARLSPIETHPGCFNISLLKAGIKKSRIIPIKFGVNLFQIEDKSDPYGCSCVDNELYYDKICPLTIRLLQTSDGRYKQFRVRYDIDFFLLKISVYRYFSIFKINIDITIKISIYRVWLIFR